jgi:hypothetical protein
VGVRSPGVDPAATVTDAGVTLTPANGCVAVDTHTVRCTPPPDDLGFGGFIGAARADLGDLDDTASVNGPPAGRGGGELSEFEVRLTRLGRRLAARQGGTRAAVTLRLITDGDVGFSFVERWTIRLEHR